MQKVKLQAIIDAAESYCEHAASYHELAEARDKRILKIRMQFDDQVGTQKIQMDAEFSKIADWGEKECDRFGPDGFGSVQAGSTVISRKRIPNKAVVPLDEDMTEQMVVSKLIESNEDDKQKRLHYLKPKSWILDKAGILADYAAGAVSMSDLAELGVKVVNPVKTTIAPFELFEIERINKAGLQSPAETEEDE